MLDRLTAIVNWLRPRLWVGKEAGSDLFGWYNAVYLRVGRYVLHVGIDRDA